jgi:hypothetical protein
MPLESKKFVATIGGKIANAYFEKNGSNYRIRTWGLKHRDILKHVDQYRDWLTLKHVDQYRDWLTQCVEEFGS